MNRKPQLVVVDIRMPPTHTTEGLDAARVIRAGLPDTGNSGASEAWHRAYEGRSTNLGGEGEARSGWSLTTPDIPPWVCLPARRWSSATGKFREACVRCSLLRPDPAQRQRLEEIQSNLKDRIAEAKLHGWLGEVEGLQVSLAGASDKLAQIDNRLRTLGPVDLGTPPLRPQTSSQ